MGLFSKLILGSLIGLATDPEQHGIQARRYLENPNDMEFKRITDDDVYHDDVKNSLGTRDSPIVQASDCTDMCLFKDNYNEWCWKF